MIHTQVPSPPPHIFACVIHERSHTPAGRQLLSDERYEEGVCRSQPHEDTTLLQSFGSLQEGIVRGWIPASTADWLKQARATTLETAVSFPLRSILRRRWVAGPDGEYRNEEQFLVVPGLGVVPEPSPPPSPTAGQPLDPSLALLLLEGSAATLLHELAGHRNQWSSDPAQWPRWLRVEDQPEPADDCGVPHDGCVDLRSAAPPAWRRWRATDTPLPRMTAITVSASGDHGLDLPRERIEVRRIAAGRYDPARDRVRLVVSEAWLISGGSRHSLTLPATIELPSRELIARIAGAAGTPREAPGVLCGDHGVDLPVASRACDLLLGARQ